jgi:hypothetical protein
MFLSGLQKKITGFLPSYSPFWLQCPLEDKLTTEKKIALINLIHHFCRLFNGIYVSTFRAISRIKKSYGRFTNLQFCAVPELPELQFHILCLETLGQKCMKYVTKFHLDILYGECYMAHYRPFRGRGRRKKANNKRHDNNRLKFAKT